MQTDVKWIAGKQKARKKGWGGDGKGKSARCLAEAVGKLIC